MTYELCLEYGTYPLTIENAQFEQDTEIPEFIKGDQDLLEKLDTVNKLFHELFLTIECQFHYVGFEYPEKRAKIAELYDEIISNLKERYPEQNIIIRKLLIH